MSQEQLVQAVVDQVIVLAGKQGRTAEDVLEEMKRYLLQQRFRNFVACNRANAEAKNYNPADVDKWVEEDRQRGR